MHKLQSEPEWASPTPSNSLLSELVESISSGNGPPAKKVGSGEV